MAELPSASLFENARFNALVVVPNAVQGIFRRRRVPVAVATRADTDRWAVGLLRGMRRSYDGGPVWVRVIKDRALLVLSEADIRRVLEGAPEPFAADPDAKRKGMSAFQPDALTISRGEEWRSRRRFTEAVLDTAEPRHRLADRFAAIAAEEADALLAELDFDDAELDWDRWSAAWRRTARRVVLGDAAREDEDLSDRLAGLMSAGNSLPSEPPEELAAFQARIDEYVEAAEEGSLAGLLAEPPADAHTRPSGQVPHWLFATQDTLAINSLRALALIASHPRERAAVESELAAHAEAEPPDAAAVDALARLGACLEEAMRLWPTTTMLSRETTEDVEWNGDVVPAGTQVVIVNTFQHRDPDTHEFAHRFAPEEWLGGSAAEDWSFNHLSHGPQGCPGAGLAIFLGKAFLATLLRRRSWRLVSPGLDPEKPLPHMLDFFGIRLAAEPI